MAANQPHYFGFNLPFYSGTQNILSRQIDEQLVKNDLLQLLLTIPGERIYRPALGTSICLVIFELVDESTLVALDSQIRSQIATYDERINIKDLILTFDDGSHTLFIKLVFNIVDVPLNLYLLDIAIDQNGVRIIR